jgi:hypothetical protein
MPLRRPYHVSKDEGNFMAFGKTLEHSRVFCT